jgi:hypothetical protein
VWLGEREGEGDGGKVCEAQLSEFKCVQIPAAQSNWYSGSNSIYFNPRLEKN